MVAATDQAEAKVAAADQHAAQQKNSAVGIVGKAVLSDPDKFAKAAKTLVEAMGLATDNADKALDVFVKARGVIASTTPEMATIVNLSSKDGTWFTYNTLAPVKYWT